MPAKCEPNDESAHPKAFAVKDPMSSTAASTPASTLSRTGRLRNNRDTILDFNGPLYCLNVVELQDKFHLHSFGTQLSIDLPASRKSGSKAMNFSS